MKLYYSQLLELLARLLPMDEKLIGTNKNGRKLFSHSNSDSGPIQLDLLVLYWFSYAYHRNKSLCNTRISWNIILVWLS